MYVCARNGVGGQDKRTRLEEEIRICKVLKEFTTANFSKNIFQLLIAEYTIYLLPASRAPGGYGATISIPRAHALQVAP